MDMFLMGLCMSLLGVAVCVALFAASTHEERQSQEARPAATLSVPLAPPQFFIDDQRPALAAPRVPLEVLLLQLERHVRLEQAAAESFIDLPTSESLHSPTTSPLMN